MKEFILVEFITSTNDLTQLLKELETFGKDIKFIDSDFEFETYDDTLTGSWHRISAQVNTESLTVIKLRSSFVAERMKISHIPDELKDRYRK